MISIDKNFLKCGALFVAGLLCGCFLFSTIFDDLLLRREKSFDISASGVLLFVFTSPKTSLVAHRKDDADDFYLHTISGGKSRHCNVSNDFGGYLHQISSFHSNNFIEKKYLRDKFPKFIGKIEIQDQIIEYDIEPIYFYSSVDGSRIAAQHAGIAGEISISESVFHALEAGCSELAKR
ncbi:hypothetical protein [Acidovorax sp. LjRoot194]|uniref:hypothetical protein n=1 Tax=Acidovorax sp. LjRoot194 TaxID=3342280 RepID=UPI003ECDD76A